MKVIFIFALTLLTCDISISQNCRPVSSDREEITELNLPSNLICHIIVRRRYLRLFHKDWPSTASFISSNVLITAGHSLVEGPGHGMITGVSIYIGQRRSNNRIEWISKKEYSKEQLKIFCDPVFTNEGKPEYDFSYVALPENISTGFFVMTEFSSIRPAIDSVYITGYPSDQTPNTLWLKKCLKDNITQDELVLKYSLFTCEGDSGAPIWTKKGNQYFIVGVHGTGNYSNGCNAGIRLTNERITSINSFIRNNAVHN